jgi:hypothetical protein
MRAYPCRHRPPTPVVTGWMRLGKGGAQSGVLLVGSIRVVWTRARRHRARPKSRPRTARSGGRRRRARGAPCWSPGAQCRGAGQRRDRARRTSARARCRNVLAGSFHRPFLPALSPFLQLDAQASADEAIVDPDVPAVALTGIAKRLSIYVGEISIDEGAQLRKRSLRLLVVEAWQILARVGKSGLRGRRQKAR